MKFGFFLSFLVLLFSCGKQTQTKTSSVSSQVNSSLYFQSSKKLVMDVFYEAGAEPFVGQNPASGKALWNIFEDNLAALFQYRSLIPEIVVPKDFPSMTNIPLQNKSTWSIDDILSLSKKFKGQDSTTDETHFSLYFVNGYAQEGQNIIGFNINGTTLIVIFKSVIKATGVLLVQKYVEQSTLIHEMGHALGLVNNGVPMKIPHEDSSHLHHTTNSNCVMYWANEGTQALINFVTTYLTTGKTIMWGPEVLKDVEALSK